MINVNQFIDNEIETINMRCRPQFLEAVKNGKEKEYYENIKLARSINPLYQDILEEIEAWIR